MRELSVVITVLNEHDNIAPLIGALQNALTGIDYEVIFVDDGSNDGTQKQVREHADERIKLVELRKNYGQSTAMTAGIDHSEGTYIALIDGDLQNDPSDSCRNGLRSNSLVLYRWDAMILGLEKCNRASSQLHEVEFGIGPGPV